VRADDETFAVELVAALREDWSTGRGRGELDGVVALSTYLGGERGRFDAGRGRGKGVIDI